MSHRVLQGPGFADMMVKRKTKPNNFLDKIQSLVKWNEIERLLSPLHSAVEGAPSYPPLCMFKMLLLQQWYALSDPDTEEAVNDRLSFRRFCGFSLSESIPDYSTLCRFRNELSEHGLGEALFESFNVQLDSLGLVLREGTLIDATVVEANVQKPTGGGKYPREILMLVGRRKEVTIILVTKPASVLMRAAISSVKLSLHQLMFTMA